MFILLIRVIVVFVILLVLVRLMGKRQIGELQPFELVITLIVADVATIPMSEPSTPLLNGLIPLIALVLMQFFLSYLTRKSDKFRKLINGKPVIVIDKNGINYENLKALNMSLNDLQEALRGVQVTKFDMVEYAMIETNGKISVIFKSSQEPPTKKELNIIAPQNALPIMIISEGKFIEENMSLANIKPQNLIKNLKALDLKMENILCMTIDGNGNCYIQPKNRKYITRHYEEFIQGDV